MISKYTVVQYLPDPLNGECINIGVVVLGDGQVLSRFLGEWDRVECFSGGRDITFLRHFAERVHESDPEQLALIAGEGLEGFSEETIAGFADSWINSIQFTTLRSGVGAPAELVDQIASRFLRTYNPALTAYDRTPAGRPRQTAARIAATGLEEAVRERNWGIDVRRKALLPGRVERHQFDAVALNGRPFAATHGLSFESSDVPELLRTIDALGLAVLDVHERYPGLPIGIVGLRSAHHEKREPYQRALSLFGAYGASLLGEHEIRSWALAEIDAYSEIHPAGPWYQQFPAANFAQALTERVAQILSLVGQRAYAAAAAHLPTGDWVAGFDLTGAPTSVVRSMVTHLDLARQALKAGQVDSAVYELKAAMGLLGAAGDPPVLDLPRSA